MTGGIVPGELLNPFEILALLDKGAKIVDVGIDAVILAVEDVGNVVIWACMNCEGDDSHLNYAFVEEGGDTTLI